MKSRFNRIQYMLCGSRTRSRTRIEWIEGKKEKTHWKEKRNIIYKKIFVLLRCCYCCKVIHWAADKSVLWNGRQPFVNVLEKWKGFSSLRFFFFCAVCSLTAALFICSLLISSYCYYALLASDIAHISDAFYGVEKVVFREDFFHSLAMLAHSQCCSNNI